ncbi:hypothetical protein OUZ56_009912 [Daphnia magna]|uniref:Uncharacterized protein n=1 Tax=Daphnia magna TaxID=35525 RepID=A0ABR0AHC2_9CRUS|nr:hypothetical protein OUZ56_009912 [Daphnia magna]
MALTPSNLHKENAGCLRGNMYSILHKNPNRDFNGRRVENTTGQGWESLHLAFSSGQVTESKTGLRRHKRNLYTYASDIMRANEDSGLETTLERRSVRKGPLIQRFVRSVRERFPPLRSGGGSTSILKNNENLGVELDSDSPHQSDIDLLDSNEIKELTNDDQWNELLNWHKLEKTQNVLKCSILEHFLNWKSITRHPKLAYGEAADEFDNFKLENPISAQIYDRV